MSADRIEIVPYDATWPRRFIEEAALIRKAPGDLALRIDHVGSTAVPGLAAKPVIDIQVSVVSLEPRAALKQLLTEIGYVHIDIGEFDAVYPFFQKPADWPSTHHVHLCRLGSHEELNHLVFRDYLRDHPATAAEYETLKRTLAAIHDGTTFEARERYSLAKTPFISTIVARALVMGYRVRPTSDD